VFESPTGVRVAVSADTRIGTELAGYQLEALLGRGGMSVVYRAADLRLRRKVALKLLAPELAEDERFRERFLRESHIAASLDHPNVVPVYDAGEADGLLYIAIRYVEGSDLRGLLRQTGALEPGHALALIAQVADALDAAHERGLVHRDVKPSNVLTSGRAGKEHCYLTDFGLAKSVSKRTRLTDSGQMVGTLDYIAPEQIQGGPVDGRADVYSIACLLYECLTGEVPFRRDSDVAVIYAHLEDAPPKVSELRPGLPAQLDDALAKGMAKRREERWRTCRELVDAAQSAVRQTGASPLLPVRAVWRRRPLVLVGVVTAMACAATVSILFLTSGESGIARSDSLVRIDPIRAKAVAGVEVPGRPSSITVCAASVFVADRRGTVSAIDPKTSTVYPIHVGGAPTDISHVGNLAAVVAAPPRDTVTLIDATFGGINWVRALPGPPSSPAASSSDGTSFWVANPNAQELERLDPAYGRFISRVSLPRPARGKASYSGVAAGGGLVWVASDDSRRMLWRVDPATRRITEIRLPFAPGRVAAGSGAAWVVDPNGDKVVRVDAETNRLTPIRVGREPRGIAAGASSVWVANELDGTVSRIDAERLVVDKTIHIGARPIGVAVGLGSVWVVRQTG
jgi:serine/threonine-protein kinase